MNLVDFLYTLNGNCEKFQMLVVHLMHVQPKPTDLKS